MKRPLLSALLLAAAIAAGLAAMEGATRLILPQQLVRDYVVADEALGMRLKPNADYRDLYGNDYRVRTNGDGFRMEEEVDRGERRRRVLAYGDSFAFGFGVEYADSYFARLKSGLERDRADFQLLNAAVPGFSTGHVRIQMLRHIPDLRPAALIYFFNHNDVFDNAITDIDYRVTEYRIAGDGTVALADRPPYAPWKRFLLNHTPYGWLNRNSHLFVGAKAAVKTLAGWRPTLEGVTLAPADGAGPVDAPAYTVSEGQKTMAQRRAGELIAISLAHLRRLKSLAAERRLPLIVVWVPAWEEIFRRDGDLPLLGLLRGMRTRTAALFAGDGTGQDAVFIDTVQMLPPAAMLRPQERNLHFVTDTGPTGFTGDGHFNQTGNRWFAALIAPVLATTLNELVPKAP